MESMQTQQTHLDDIIIIHLDLFMSIGKNHLQGNLKFKETMRKLVETYTCFTDHHYFKQQDGHQKNKGFQQAHNQNQNNQNNQNNQGTYNRQKPSFLKRELTKDEKVHKEFTALMNKLTDENCGRLTTEFLTHVFNKEFVSMYVNCLWNNIYKQAEYQDNFIAIIWKMIERDTPISIVQAIFKEKMDAYTKNREFLIELPQLTEGESYDEFCDFVKEKKYSIGKLQAFLKLSKLSPVGQLLIVEQPVEQFITPMIDALTNIDQSTHNWGIVDVIIDHIQAVYENLDNKMVLAEKMTHWLSINTTCPSKTKFKILNICDIIQAKYKEENNNLYTPPNRQSLKRSIVNKISLLSNISTTISTVSTITNTGNHGAATATTTATAATAATSTVIPEPRPAWGPNGIHHQKFRNNAGELQEGPGFLQSEGVQNGDRQLEGACNRDSDHSRHSGNQRHWGRNSKENSGNPRNWNARKGGEDRGRDRGRAGGSRRPDECVRSRPNKGEGSGSGRNNVDRRPEKEGSRGRSNRGEREGGGDGEAKKDKEIKENRENRER